MQLEETAQTENMYVTASKWRDQMRFSDPSEHYQQTRDFLSEVWMRAERNDELSDYFYNYALIGLINIPTLSLDAFRVVLHHLDGEGRVPAMMAHADYERNLRLVFVIAAHMAQVETLSSHDDFDRFYVTVLRDPLAKAFGQEKPGQKTGLDRAEIGRLCFGPAWLTVEGVYTLDHMLLPEFQAVLRTSSSILFDKVAIPTVNAMDSVILQEPPV